MALVVKDRVQETTTTTGTGTLTLGGAVLGFQSFATIGNGNATYYTINDTITGDWEVGIGTYTASGTTLSRTTVLSSSNGGALVSFAAGSKNVFVTYPSERAVYKDLADVYTVQQAFDALTANSIALTSGTITTTPVNNTDIVNKQYADAIASGIHFHEAVDLATTTALPANTYNNGTSGVGATLTATANGALSVDSTLTVAANRILVKNEAAQANNGVYTVTQVGSAGTPYILTRATDFDTAGTGVNQIDEGDFFLVTSGTVNLNTAWVQQTAPPITVGTTAIVFQQFAAPITYTAGTGLNESPSYTFNIATTGVSAATYGSASQVPVFAVNAQGQITSVTNTAIAIAAGAVSGLAASATTDTTNAANISSGTLPTGRLSGSYTGITGVGTLAAGTWNGSVIGPVYGGTGFGTYAVGDLLYADTTSSLAKLADVAVGNALISGGVGSAPSWGKIGLATHVSGTLPIANGGTNTSATATNGGVTYGTGTAYAFTAAGTSGQILQSNGAAAPTWVSLSTLGVSSFSAGTTGFTPSSATSGAVTLAGTLNVANGGTGVTTSTGSGSVVLSTSPSLVTPILGTPQSGNFSTGTFTWPTFNQNTTGNAATATSAVTLFGSTNLYISPTNGNTFNSGYGNAADGSDVWLNYRGYNDGFSYFRNFNLGNGKGTAYVYGDGVNQRVGIAKGQAASYTLDVAGIIYSNTSARAPIFYDSDDTTYYLDPNSTTSAILAGSVGVGSTSPVNAAWGTAANTKQITIYGSNYGVLNIRGDLATAAHYSLGVGGTRYYAAYDNVASVHRMVFFGDYTGFNNVTTPAYNIHLAGTGYATGDWRAPIFYDSNNTAYFVNPDSISIMYGVTINGSGSGTDVSNQLFLWSSGGTTSAMGFKAPGGVWANPTGAGDGYNTYLTMDTAGRGWVFGERTTGFANVYTSGWILNNGLWQANASMRAPIFYDSNDTGYFIDPASTSNSALRMRGGALFGPNTTWGAYLYVGTNGNIDVNTATVAATNGNLHLDAANGYVLYLNNYATSSYTVLNQSARSPIFYDLNDTGYYVNPNGTSQLSYVLADNWFRSQGNSGLYFQTYGWGIWAPESASNNYGNVATYGAGRNGWMGYGIGSRHTLMSTGGDNVGIHDSSYSWVYYWDGTSHTFNRGYTQAAGSLRAPLFYDSGDTAYYLDPAGTSNLNSATFTSGGQCITAYGNGSVNGSAGIGLNVYSSGGNGAIMAFHRGGYFAVNMGLDSDNVLRIGGWSAAANRWQLDMSGNNTIAGDFYAVGNMKIGKGNNFVATNTAVGVSALASVNSNYHTAVGYQALQGMTTYTNPVFAIAGGSTAVGYGALQSNVGNTTLGSGNTAIGSGAMYNATGAYLCTAVGAYAGFNLTSGATNTIMGHRAGQYLSNNSSCIIIGYNAAPNLNSSYGTGNGNVIVGNNSFYSNLGSNNTILGNNTGINMNFADGSASANNVLIGANTLATQSTATNRCTFVGQASMNTWDGDITNSSSLGYLTNVTGNNQVQLGNDFTTTYVYGTVQNRSDARDKADIRDTQLGLDFIEALRPVDFRWDYRESYVDFIESEDEEGKDTSTRVENPQDGSRKRTRYHHGLIAQEVKEVLDAKGIDFGGYQDHSVAGGKDVLTIGYDELVGPLIKAVQELSIQVKALSLELADLKAKS